MQLASLFRRWGKVAKVVLHFPTKSILVKHSEEMSKSVTKLRFAERTNRLMKIDDASTDEAAGRQGRTRRSSTVVAMTKGDFILCTVTQFMRVLLTI